MWKKLGVICIAFISTCSVIYAFNGEMKMSTMPTTSGGEVYGRVGNPIKGDRFYISTNQEAYQMLANTDEGLVSASDKPAPMSTFFANPSDITDQSIIHTFYTRSSMYSVIKSKNLSINSKDLELLNFKAKEISYDPFHHTNAVDYDNMPWEYVKYFVPLYFYGFVELPGFTFDDLAFSQPQWFSYQTNGSYTPNVILQNGTIEQKLDRTFQASYRDIIYVKKDKIVFGVSNGSNSDGSASEIIKPSVDSQFVYKTVGDPMVLRVESSQLTSTTTFDGIENAAGDTISTVAKDSTIYLNASAQADNIGEGVNQVSALLFNKEGDFAYYLPLENAKGAGKYAFDLMNIPVGEYTVGIVNEAVIAGYNGIIYSSAITSKKAIEITSKLSDLSHTSEHGTKEDPYLSSKNGNVLKNNTLATISSNNGIGNNTVNGVFENGIHYQLQASKDATHANDKNQFVIPTDQSDGKMLLNANNKPYVIVNPENSDNYLASGVYKYRIQAYDANGDPIGARLNDGTEVIGISPNQGLVTEDITTVVYPHFDQATFKQTKNTSTDAYYTLDELKELAPNSTLGTLNFETSANLQKLADEGYTINSIKAVKPGTSTNLTAFDVKPLSGNVNNFEFKKLAGDNFVKGNLKFDLIITYCKDGTDTAVIKKVDQLFSIPDALRFADPKDPSAFLKSSSYKYDYNSDISSNEITLVATDKTAGTALNSNVKYCIYENDACVGTSSVVEFIAGASNGAQKIKITPPGTENKSVTIRATLMDTDGVTVATFKDINLIIMPTLQTLSWSGTNIQSDGNNISKNTEETNPTWNLSLKYDSETPANNIYNIDALLKGGTLTDKNIALVTNLVSGTTPNIEYKVIPSNNDDKENIVIANGKLEIKALLKDGFAITAIGKATGNYSATTDVDDPTTPTVNEYSHAILKVAVSDKPKVEFTPDFTNSIIAGSTMANGTVALGTLKITPNTVTDYENYAIASVGKLVEPVADEENPQYDTVASDLFRIDLPTKKLFAKNSSTGLVSGTYKVKVKATKDLSSDEATAKDIQIVVKNATLDVSKIKWKYKDDGIAWKECEGSIDPTDDRNLNSKAISQVFKEEKTFQVQVADKDTSTQISSADSIDYVLKKDSTTGIVEVSKTGTIRVKNAGSTNVVVEAIIKKSGVNDTSVFIPIEIEQATPEVQFVQDDGITSYPLQNASDTSKYKTVEQEYSSNKGIGVFTKGVPTGSKIIFTILDKGSSTGNDVLAFKSADSTNLTCEIAADEYATQRLQKCEAIIKNAQKTINDKGKIILQASSEETNNYKAISLEMPININKAKQTDFDFVSTDETYESSQEGIIEPTFIIKDQAHPNVGTGTITLFTTDANGDSDLSSNELRLGNPTSDTSKYTDGIKNYIYNIVVASADTSKQFSIYALKEGDRNYKESDLKSQQITITPEDTSKYRLFFKSYPTAGGGFVPNVEYGHEYFHISAKSNDDEMDPDSTYAFEVIDEFNEYVEVYGSNNGDFKALKAGKIKIKVTRTSGNGVISPSVNGSITIEPKLVKLKVADITKKNGMSVVASDYAFSSASDEFLASDKEKLDIKISAQDVNGKDMTEFSDGIRIEHNNLPIIASITNQNANDDVLSNYKIMNMDGKTAGIEKGKLIVSEEESKASWYEVQHATDTLLGREGWYNGDVEMVLQAAAGSFDKISNDAKDWKSDKFTFTKEGKNTTTIYFRDSNAKTISKPQSKEIKIDRTNPIIKKVTGEKVNDGGVANFINKITFGAFFKPGVEVVMESEDTNTDTSIETSGIASIDYTVFAKNGDTFEEIDTGSATMSETTGKIKLADAGVYRVCVIAKDNAGNASEEYCSELNVKKIDVDIDGDGPLDMNDSNDDGCPDINIVLGKDEEEKWIKLNVDRNKDKLPDLNVDSDGDGIAELNIDMDQDGNPDINLVKISKEMWKPDYCVSNQKEEYCTTQGIKANINVNVSESSYINIDNNGDMKADVNITKEGSTIPYINLLLDETIIWNPQKDFTKDEFTYDTMDTLKAELNIDSDHDGLPDMNVDMGGDRKPDINVDVDEDGIPDINIDGDGDGEKDYNIDTDGDGEADEDIIDLDEWNPTIKGDDYGTMDLVTKDELEDGGIKVERPNGKFLANYALRVNNVTESISESDKSAIDSVIETNQEIKQVYNVAMMKGETSIQPNSILKVRIPIIKGLMNPKIVITQKDGSEKVIDAVEEKEYYVYESDYLGNVSIIGDKEDAPIVKDDLDTAETIKKPSIPTSVKGNYVSGGIGGAGTGDNTNVLLVAFMGLVSGVILLRLYQVRRKS